MIQSSKWKVLAIALLIALPLSMLWEIRLANAYYGHPRWRHHHFCEHHPHHPSCR